MSWKSLYGQETPLRYIVMGKIRLADFTTRCVMYPGYVLGVL